MKIKINILIVTIILTVIVFCISTYMQKKLINYEPTVSCLFLDEDVYENELVNEENFRTSEVPISLVANQKIVTNFNELEGLYAKDNIKKGQIAIKSQFDTKENLSIYEAEEGKEKISIKIKSAENGMSFQLKENSIINVYVTIRNEYANGFLSGKSRLAIGNEYDGYTVIKILENVKVLGVFTIDGIDAQDREEDNIDSVLISVTPEEAKQVNLLREIATFSITGINDVLPKVAEINEINNSGEMSGDEM